MRDNLYLTVGQFGTMYPAFEQLDGVFSLLTHIPDAVRNDEVREAIRANQSQYIRLLRIRNHAVEQLYAS